MPALPRTQPPPWMYSTVGSSEPVGAERLDDADLHVADRGRHGDPFLVDVELVDRRGLDVVEHLAGTVGAEVVEERRLRRGVGELLGGRLQDVVGHGGPPSWDRCVLEPPWCGTDRRQRRSVQSRTDL